jgi:outer membrane protein assembly factor BamD (BamD/ComL family)
MKYVNALFLCLALGALGGTAVAQGTAEPPAAQEPAEKSQDSGDENLGTRDTALEKKAAKNVEIAEFYMKGGQRRYQASINRLIEIYEVYPQYTKFDKVLFLLGKYTLGWAKALEAEAKTLELQGQSEPAKAKLKEAAEKPAEAKKYFQELSEKFPQSSYVKEAQKELEKLKP